MAEPAFPDKGRRPDYTAIGSTAGSSFEPVDTLLTALRDEYPGITADWKFSKQSGWFLTFEVKKKRLFYLLPQQGDFIVRIVFSEKTASAIMDGDYPDPVKKKLAAAQKFPEGKPVSFDASDFEADTVDRLIRLKIQG